jgi:hypothetical protein
LGKKRGKEERERGEDGAPHAGVQEEGGGGAAIEEATTVARERLHGS